MASVSSVSSVSLVPFLCFGIIFATFSLIGVEARSNGILGYCDLSSVHKYGRGTGVMNWVDPPANTTFYTIRSGDDVDVASDPVEYIPNVLTTIHIRVRQLDRKFIGMVLYATNSSNADGTHIHVGSWQIPVGQEFQLTPSCTSSVTHSNANIKPLHTRFFWSAPPGTGKVNFKILIKQGEQAKGSFFIPIKPLSLREGTAKAPLPTVLATNGMSCAEVCKTVPSTPYCHYQNTASISSSSSLASQTNGLATCRLPYFASCEPYAPFENVASGYCTYRANCSKVDVCLQTTTLGVNRFCACSASALDALAPADAQPTVMPTDPPQPTMSPTLVPPDTTPPTQDPASSSSSTGLRRSASPRLSSPTFLIALLGFVSMVFSGSSSPSTRTALNAQTMIFLVITITLIASPCSAHNYIKSQHRAQRAAVSVPCVAKITNQPHVQVAAGQEFTIEWSDGHGDYTVGPVYFAVVAAADYRQLAASNITSIIQDYLNNAPPSAILTGNNWTKRHLRSQSQTPVNTYFTSPALAKNDPLYIPRDAVYGLKSDYGNDPNLVQTAFISDFTARDKRASYVSTKYPFIESASRFEIVFKEHALYNDQADMAKFTIPAYHGTGDYVIYFEWSGYKDCVDVNVVPGSTPTPHPYGLPVSVNNTASLVRIDHCEFTNIPQPATPCRRVDPSTMNVQQCMKDCLSNDWCTGVQVVRATNPSNTLPFTVNIPITQFNYTFVDAHPDPAYPCMWPTVHNRTTLGCHVNISSYYKCDPAQFAPNDYVCFGLNPYRNQDLQVSEDYTTANEIADPVFYSTCYIKVPAGGFVNIPKDTVSPPSWLAQEDCLSCDYIKNKWPSNTTYAPDWTKAVLPAGANCVSCDPMVAPM